MKRISLSLLALFLTITFLTKDLQAETGEISTNATKEAISVINGLHERLIKTMKMGKDGKDCSKRYKFLENYIKQSFYFPLISRIVLGRRHWSKLDEKKKRDFMNAFIKMTISTYASRFDSFSGQSFKTKKAILNKSGHVLVDSSLVKSNGEEIDFKYLLTKAKDGWKIVSVSAKGVNDLSVKRADYNAFLKDHSIDDLIKKLLEKTDKCISNKKTS